MTETVGFADAALFDEPERAGDRRKGSAKPKRRNATSSGTTGHLVGYARVSTAEQVLDRQVDALRAVGCDRIFTDQASGARQRPGLDDCVDYLRPGDTLVVQALDRLGRKTSDLLLLVEDLDKRGVALQVLTLGLDTSTPAGRLVLTVIAALAEMEREVMLERTRDGIAAARARGRVGGRPPALSPEQVTLARQLSAEGKTAVAIGRLLGTSDRTIRRHLAP